MKIKNQEDVAPAKELACDPQQWLEDFGDWLYQYALIRVGDSHTAEDLVQDTLIRGYQGFHRFSGRSKPGKTMVKTKFLQQF